MYTSEDERNQRRLEKAAHQIYQEEWSNIVVFVHRRPGRNNLIVSIDPPNITRVADEVETYLSEQHGLRTTREEGPDFVDIKATV